MHEKVDLFLPDNNITFGAFCIEYKAAKDQIKDLFDINLNNYKKQLIKEYQYFSIDL